MNQETIDMAVKIATREAMYGNPVERITWVPPTSATQSPIGTFVVKYCVPETATQLPYYLK